MLTFSRWLWKTKKSTKALIFFPYAFVNADTTFDIRMAIVWNTLWQLVAVFILVLLNGFFVAAEFALVGARRTYFDHLAAQGSSIALVTRTMIDNLDRYIAAAQLGITLASLALGWIGEAAIAHLVEPPIVYVVDSLLGSLHFSDEIAVIVSHAIGVAVSFFIITTLHIVLGEQAPKVFAIRSPERVALFITQPLAWFNTLFAPLIHFLNWATDRVLQLFGVQEAHGGHGKVHSAYELRMLVEESAEAGHIDQEAETMLTNVLSFAERPAYQVMVPRREMVTIPHTASLQDFLEHYSHHRHTRYPVVGPNGIDEIQGVVSVKDLVILLRNDAVELSQSIAPLVREVIYTPESKQIGTLMQEMRATRRRMAILIDEYGGVAGLVTLENLIEEIVGDLQDDYEIGDESRYTITDSKTLVEGQIRIDELNEELGIALPKGEYETLAGFILETLGRLPEVGDDVQYGDWRFIVSDMQGPRIAQLEIRKEG